MFNFLKKATNTISAELLEEIETELIAADLGTTFTKHVLDILKEQKSKTEFTEVQIKELISAKLEKFLRQYEKPLELPDAKPAVILTCGANGSGKTTTVSKLAYRLQQQGKKVLLVAADTFRSGAVEQLCTLGANLGIEVFSNPATKDAAAVTYQSYDYAKEKGFDVVIIDTSGRLTNNTNLMDELKKIISVLKKHGPELPHHNLLILDGTIGQAALMIARGFLDAIGIDSLVITKLDGSSKGGALLPLSHYLRLPIQYIGVGEKKDDLKDFNASRFAKSLVGLQD